MSEKSDKELIKKYYDQVAPDYIHMYEQDYLSYPANAIRLNIVIRQLLKNKIKTILDVGCGTCGPLKRFIKEGFACKGCDFSEEMIKVGKQELKKEGIDENLIFVADLENDSSLTNEKFDALIAFGVFPHILDEEKALLNMNQRLDKGGKVFIEFRNELFSIFTLNNYSVEFFLNKVIKINTFPNELKSEIMDFYKNLLKFDKKQNKENGISYTEIFAKFRNPLSIEKELFKKCGFRVDHLHFYHYHALPPFFEDKHPELFRKLSLAIENPADWRGHLMSSAFVVEATKID